MNYRQSDAAGAPITVVAFHGHLIGANPRTGARIWQLKLDGRPHAVRIALAEEHVFALAQETLSCIEYLTGTVRWTVAASGGTLLVDDGLAFVGSGGSVTCYSTVDGSLLWRDGYEGMGVTPVALGVPGNVVQADRS